MPIRAIGFDIDGTLYPAAALYRRLFWKSLGQLRFLIAFNGVRHDLRRLLDDPEYRSRGIDSIEGLHRFQAKLMAERLGGDPDRLYERIEAFFYTTSVEPFTTIPPFQGVTSLLDELRGLGLGLGALSDFPCDRKVELLGLADKLDVALTSEETGLVKPDRASFDLLASRLGVPNGDILYVGNSERYDVRGALGAGMRAALITKDRKAAASSAAEFTFFDFADLGRYIRGAIAR
jgi:putative hydrolase of the HAD superfamily